MATFFSYEFEKFTNRGSILNLQGFPGTVELRNNLLDKNMVYIKDILIRQEDHTTYITPESMKYSLFQANFDKSYFRFKVCDEDIYEGLYAFEQMFDPNKEFEDDKLNELYEAYSPIYISANKAPMIFVGNTFTHNIGTVGGVINIQSPNYEKAMSIYEYNKQSAHVF